MAAIDRVNMSGTLFRVRIVQYLFIITGLLFVSSFAKAQSNSEPFMDTPSDQIILEDAVLQVVNLTGITDNNGAIQIITITAVSSNQAVIPDASITVNYTDPQTTGTLDYTVNPDENGLVSITLTVMDDGGIAMGGDDTFITNFTVTVNPVNDKPTFSEGPDLPVSPTLINEDAGTFTSSNWATNINAGGTIGNENFQNLTFILTSLGTSGNLTFDDLIINSAGTISFTPTANTNGTDTIKVELQDDGLDTPPDENLSVSDTLIISVTAVNDPPVFIPGSDITMNEGDSAQAITAWATGMGPGGGSDETGQNLTFNLVELNVSTFLTFITPPSIDVTTGDLTFEVETDANGSATYEVTLVDDGPSGSPDNNTSVVTTLNITVNAINDPPSATIPTTYDTTEDAGEVSVPDFATDISAGGADELTSQTVTFELEVLGTTGTLAFDQDPQISNAGTFTFIASENTNGTADVQISIIDDGPSDSPNNNLGAISNLTINVAPVNDRPTFTKGSDPTLLEDNGPTIFTAWAQNISAGPSDESGQTVNFQITQVWTEGNIAFVTGPDLSPTGDLSFETALNTNGRAAYEIVLVDDGASDGLNLNTSAIQSLVFEITAVNDSPEYVIGPDQTVDENSGLITVESWATDMSPGGGTDEEAQTFTFTAEPFEIIGNLVFTIGPLISPEGDLSFQSAPNTFGSAEFLLNLVDDGPSEVPNNNTSVDQTFFINVTEINDAPTDIVLSNNSISEKLPINTFIGAFTAIDSDDDTHTFSLVGGIGSDDNGSFLIDGNQLLSNATFDFATKNLYTIRVSASDIDNILEQIFLIDVLREPISSVIYPSAFTPNGDGENDTWQIENIEYFPGAVITIYNRNGQKVFDSIGYQEAWDGTYNGSDLTVDTYYAVIKLNNDIDTINATVTILR